PLVPIDDLLDRPAAGEDAAGAGAPARPTLGAGTRSAARRAARDAARLPTCRARSPTKRIRIAAGGRGSPAGFRFLLDPVDVRREQLFLGRGAAVGLAERQRRDLANRDGPDVEHLLDLDDLGDVLAGRDDVPVVDGDEVDHVGRHHDLAAILVLDRLGVLTQE